VFIEVNRPFPNYRVPQFQNESSCKTFHNCEDEFDFHEKEFLGRTHFHKNGFVRRLVLTHAKGYRNGLVGN